jgi:hypothetical protein
VQDGDNFAYAAQIEIEEQAVKSDTAITIDWSELSNNLYGDLIQASVDIDTAELLAFPQLTVEEVADGLANDSLVQSDLGLYVTCSPKDAACDTDGFAILGSTIDVPAYFSEGSGTWLVALTHADVAGAVSLVALRPEEASKQTVVTFESNSSSMTITVDLDDQSVVHVPAGDAVIDWSECTVDGLGASLRLGSLDTVQIARFSSNLEALSDDFVHLVGLADEIWEMNIEGSTEISLSEFWGDSPPVASDDIWLMAWRCSVCDSPVPRLLVVLEGVGQ